MNRFIDKLRHPIVEVLNVLLQLYLVYRFTYASYNLFNTKEITSESSVIGQFFGTRTSLLVLGVLYGVLALLLAVSLIVFALRGSRRLNNIVLIGCYALVGYTLSFLMLFNPQYIDRLLLVLGYSSIIIIAWLRNMLITRRPRKVKIERSDLLED